MSQDALKGLILWCMYFSDNWDEDREDNWDSFYTDKYECLKAGTAEHWKKFAQLEVVYNARRCQAIGNFGCWLTAGESRASGWYHSVTTIEPEHKPVCTGVTLHSLCRLIQFRLFHNLSKLVYFGILRLIKLWFIRTPGNPKIRLILVFPAKLGSICFSTSVVGSYVRSVYG